MSYPRIASPTQSQGIEGFTGTVGIHQEIHLEPLWKMLTLQQTHEEGGILRLGRRLPEGV